MKPRWITLAIITILCATAAAQDITVRDIWQKAYDDDFRGVRTLAQQSHDKSPDDLERSALLVFFATDPRVSGPVLSQMKSKAPDSPWTMLASVGSDGFGADAVCEKAVQRANGDPAVLVLASAVMSKHARSANQFDSLAAFLGRHRAELDKNSDALISEARGIQSIATSRQDKSKRDDMIALCDKALALDPVNVSAIVFKGKLLRSRKSEDGYEFLKSHATKLPDSILVHAAYWEAASTQGNAGTLQKDITADIMRFMTKEPDKQLLYLATGTIEESMPEVSKAIREFVTSKYPDSEAAEQIALNDCLKELQLSTPEQNRDAQTEKLTAFVKRPKHVSKSTLQFAQSALEYRLAQQDKPDLALLYEMVEAQPGDMFWDGVRKLAEAKYRLNDLERLVVEQQDTAWEGMRNAAVDIPDPHFAINFWIANRTVQWEAAAGYVYLQQGKLDTAEAKIKAAIALGGGKGAEPQVDLGRIYEARNDFDKAETQYSDALSAPYYGDSEHPAVGALRTLYVKRHGNTDALAAYMNPIIAKETEQRKARILAERGSNVISAFKFTTLEGKEVSYENLKGKVLVINFWATWCGPCRKEMPELEKFYQKYKDDPNVAILAVSTDETDTPSSAVDAVIKRGGYHFPVVRGFDYATTNRINSIPMTWFIAPDGKRVFQKLGATKQLEEEFTWRVENLKSPTSQSKPVEKKPLS